jgi:hypothetical protein
MTEATVEYEGAVVAQLRQGKPAAFAVLMRLRGCSG